MTGLVPVQKLSATTLDVPSCLHATLWSWVPEPQLFEQAVKPDVAHVYVGQPACAHADEVAGFAPAPEHIASVCVDMSTVLTHVTVRVDVAGGLVVAPPHVTTVVPDRHAPNDPTCHWYEGGMGHPAVLHAWMVGGCVVVQKLVFRGVVWFGSLT